MFRNVIGPLYTLAAWLPPYPTQLAFVDPARLGDHNVRLGDLEEPLGDLEEPLGYSEEPLDYSEEPLEDLEETTW